MQRCEHCKEFCGDGIEETEGHDYYSCELKNDRDMNEYGTYSSLANSVDEDECTHYLCEKCLFKEEKEADRIEIKLKDIVKLQRLYIDIFSEEDEDYPDKRIISNKERAVQKILDKITNKKFYQGEIWEVIQLKSWDTNDSTYKPICERLRELGYKIADEKRSNCKRR